MIAAARVRMKYFSEASASCFDDIVDKIHIYIMDMNASLLTKRAALELRFDCRLQRLTQEILLVEPFEIGERQVFEKFAFIATKGNAHRCSSIHFCSRGTASPSSSKR